MSTQRRRHQKSAVQRPAQEPVRQLSAPEPLRPLGELGRAVWDRVWSGGPPSWISAQADVELLQMLAESADERAALRYRVLKGGDWHDRNALRQIDIQMLSMLARLGFTPSNRALFGWTDETAPKGSRVDELAKRRTLRRADTAGAAPPERGGVERGK